MIEWVMPAVIGVVYVWAVSLVAEPKRQQLHAIIVAGAGAGYLNGGFGVWEFAYMVVATAVAYNGLRSYTFIGVAWLMHTGWDVMHHLYGTPIVPFVATSSFGCAVCDTVIGVWCLAEGRAPARVLPIQQAR